MSWLIPSHPLQPSAIQEQLNLQHNIGRPFVPGFVSQGILKNLFSRTVAFFKSIVSFFICKSILS